MFTATVAVLNYQLDNMIYNTSATPANFIVLTILSAIMPYLIFTVLSFLIALIVSNATKSADKKETERLPQTQTTLEEVKS